MKNDLDLFCYNAAAAAIAIAATPTVTIRIPREKDFSLREIRTTGVANVFMTFQTADGYLFSANALNATLIGCGIVSADPLRLPEPVLIKGGTEVNINLNNLSGALVPFFEVQLWGKKL